MADRWLNMAEAAAALQVSTRTLQRRLAEGRYTTRRQPDGRTEVLIDAPATDGGHVADIVADAGEKQIQLAGGAVAGWQAVAKAHEGELHRTRRRERFGWSLVAALALTLLVITWWTTKCITGARGDLAAERRESTRIASERDRMAGDLTAIREALTAAEVELGVLRAAQARQRETQLTADTWTGWSTWPPPVFGDVLGGGTEPVAQADP